MTDDAWQEFLPVRRAWYVQVSDFAREVFIVPVEEDAEGWYRFIDLVPVVPIWPGRKAIPPRNVMAGAQPLGTIFKLAEAEQLMDALWRAGIRPTRR